MKISIAWVFDHIDADWHKYNIADIVQLFNEKVAEIEGFDKVETPVDRLFVAKVTDVAAEHVMLYIPEIDQNVELPKREHIKVGDCYILNKDDKKVRWATGSDFGGQKDLLPAVFCDEKQAKGGWKETIEAEDWIIEVDNKSITHRPDMWGHRGFAREIAILLDLKLKPLDDIIVKLPITEYMSESKTSADMPFSVRIVDRDYIDRFGIAYFSNIENRASLPWMASRLAKVETRPIDTLVDMTNYVMLDISQPTHAFEAQKIATRHFEPRLAQKGETLTLLDDDTIELTETDMVITDGQQPIALGGIMGGKETEVDINTTSMILESAHFDATTIRLTAARHKKRTEASARFEKTLDPNQNILGIERFVKLLTDAHIPFQLGGVVSVGQKTEPITVLVEHNYIEDRLGTSITTDKIVNILQALDCVVQVDQKDDQTIYHVEIPTSRCTKDMQIKEDIVEEVARIFGYTNIPYVLPAKETKPSNVEPMLRLCHIKRLLAFGYNMREVYNYAFFDEDFLRILHWQPTDYLSVQSPVSENWQKLATSLIPGLLKNISQNNADHDQLRFFEVGRIWHKDASASYERSQLAIMWYDKKTPISFYTFKSMIAHMADMMRMPLTYEKIDAPADPWFAPYQTAHVKHGDVVIGTIGIIDVGFTHGVFDGYAAACVFDADFLQQYEAPAIVYKSSSKYPGVARDISTMVPITATVAHITHEIHNASEYIDQVELIDTFKKDDWQDQKSLTFSFVIQDSTKTLTSQQADAIYADVVTAVNKLGAQIR